MYLLRFVVEPRGSIDPSIDVKGLVGKQTSGKRCNKAEVDQHQETSLDLCPKEFEQHTQTSDYMKPTWKGVNDVAMKARAGPALKHISIPYTVYEKCAKDKVEL